MIFKSDSGKDFLDFPMEVKADDVTEDGTFSGFASTFGGPPDSGGDIIENGAFKKTIQKKGRNGNGIAMLWQHKADQPVGVWTNIEERQKGLFVTGELLLETQLGKETHIRLQRGAIKGMSIGFNPIDAVGDTVNRRRVRRIKEAELWEISLVTFPMNRRAQVTSVKAIEDAETPREMEHALRDAGLSKNAAQYIVSLCKAGGLREVAKEPEIVDNTDVIAIYEQLKKINQNFKNW
jgi:HK97 family phage prohead protease